MSNTPPMPSEDAIVYRTMGYQRTNKLILHTDNPSVVAVILLKESLIEPHYLPKETPEVPRLEIAYPDDMLSQALGYWLVMAQGCGLISKHEFIEHWRMA